MGTKKAEDAAALNARDGGGAVTDMELIAVICAAAAAYEEDAAGNCVWVRKIDRSAGRRTAWNLAGLREVIDSRRI